MFERYNESARRVLFFSRYEVGQLGGVDIGTEHLLLGLMREPTGVVGRILAPLPLDAIRTDIKSRSTFREKLATSVEVPFTNEATRVLNVTAEEADRLLHSYIGPEHLLLALLREEQSAAATILGSYGLRLEDVRMQVVQLLEEARQTPAETRFRVFEPVDRIEGLVAQLAQTSADVDAAHVLVEQIREQLNALRQQLDS